MLRDRPAQVSRDLLRTAGALLRANASEARRASAIWITLEFRCEVGRDPWIVRARLGSIVKLSSFCRLFRVLDAVGELDLGW